MRPRYALRVEGRDITDQIDPRLLSLTVDDQLGGEADRLELRLQDHGGALPLPAPRARLTVALGLGDVPLWDMGAYLVDQVECTGPDGVLSVTARSADLGDAIRAPRSQAWTGASLGDIAGDVAARNGLELRIDPALGGHAFTQVEQASESDLHLVTRLARDLDATAKIAEGALLITPSGAARTISGQALTPALIVAPDLSAWRWRRASRNSYGAVTARWGDRRGGALREIMERNGDGPVHEIRRPRASEAEARAAAARKASALSRAGETLSLSCKTFRPDVAAGSPLDVSSLRAAVDGAWTARRVTHRLDAAGLLTEIEAEPAAGRAAADEVQDG